MNSSTNIRVGRTSIPCSDATRDQLVSQKQASETWDDCLTRLADSTVETDEANNHTDEILTELRQLNEQLDTDTEEQLTINGIREAIRIEIRNQFEEFRQ